ncbi:MAG: PrsW family intramembrane metalloprotease [Bacilli bacterium]|nr:PrsW family intramembrane metalloprotease [Bacilli bacterium]
MNISFLFVLAALPVVFILLFVYKKDKNKEPLSLLIKLFLGGFASCFLVLLVSYVLGLFFPFMDSTLPNRTFLDIILYAFIGVALVEEVSKWIIVYLMGYHSKEFDELYDGLVYSIFVSLGFAFVENILYVVMTSSISTALLRAVSAVPSHACDAVFMGYYISLAKQYSLVNKRDGEKKNLRLSILIPTLLHGVYDYCLMSNYDVLVGIFVVFVIILYFISIKRLKNISINNKKILFRNKFCGNCGRAVTGPFCANCGSRQE